MVTNALEAPYDYFLLDSELSREIDSRTIEETGIDGFTLMEVAGSSAARHILADFTDLSHGIFICGKGNNAGDALVVARYLIQHGIQATLVFISGTDDLSPDTEKNLRLVREFQTGDHLTIIDSWEAFSTPSDFDFIVDGMLGTGLNSDVRGDYAKAVQWINEQEQTVFAMDIPTGLHADSGSIMGCSVQARRTFAFGGLKQGFYLEDGPAVTGKVTYCELPFPNAFKESCRNFLLDESWISLDPPAPGRHKYDSGLLYVVAGSEGLTGAAMMACESAWAEGLGAVVLICPRGVLSIYEQSLPSIIKKPVGNKGHDHFRGEHLQEVLTHINEKEGSVLLGPGLGREESTVAFVEGFLSENTHDTVIDADGLWCLSELDDWQKPAGTDWILTPHPGELGRLVSQKISGDYERLETVREFSQKHQLTVLSKGMPGMIGTPSGNCYLTNYNTRYFARAGSGDVLAGKAAASLALGFAPDRSCGRALIDGKLKLHQLLKSGKMRPEPIDFI